MNHFITRRAILGSALLYPILSFTPAARAADSDDDIDRRLAELEKRAGGRFGVSVLDTETNISFGYRGSEPFPMCSTFKALAAGFVLARADKGEEKLDRRLTYAKEKLLPYSPVTEKHAGTEGMTIAELCEAAVTLSDNTAANLLLDSFGGPKALTEWLRSIGDGTTRLDRTEPDLNEGREGDPRDTTTPDAMLDTLGNLALGSVLTEQSCDTLISWLVACSTGLDRLRAGVPSEWKAGDKTGTNSKGASGDIAIFWPPDRGPIVAAVYTAGATAPQKELNAIFAEVGKMVAEMV